MLLHYSALAEFRRTFYKDLLTLEHLKGGMVSMETLKNEYGVELPLTFWGWELGKGTERYLLPGKMGTEFIKLRQVLPILADDTRKVSFRGQVYNLIETPRSMRFKPTAHYTFKQMVDKFSDTPHSNPSHYKLLWFIGLTSMMDRAYFRICSPPSMGKSSVVDTLGHLIGTARKITRPTLARLENMTDHKWVVLDEANDLATGVWKDIDNHLLDLAGFTPSMEKHSMGPKHTLDVSQHSFSLFYNDITDYPEKSEYFDDVTKKALRDRFPAIRVHGGFAADFNAIRSVNIHDFVKEHKSDYIKLIETFTYYKDHLFDKENKNRFSLNVALPSMPERWRTNIDKLLLVISLYSESQQEFDDWVSILRGCMVDYSDMLKFPALYDRAKKKYSSADIQELNQRLRSLGTFKEKNELVSNYDGMLFDKPVKAW